MQKVQTGALERQGTTLLHELHPFAWIYFCLSFLDLRSRLDVTPDWFDGRLEHNHSQLLAFQYSNNEQSRVLQFYIPELLARTFGMTIPHAYIVQRWLFVGMAFVLFHLYVRKWFSRELSFAAVCLLAAVLPFSFENDLQESAPFLMVTFVAGLWTLRDGPGWSFAVALLVGALNNETTLSLPVIYFADRLQSLRPKAVWEAARRTIAVATPALLFTAWIRYSTRHNSHLGGAWHWPDNIDGILDNLWLNPLDYPYQGRYLSIFFIFNVLWVVAFLRRSEKPRFIRATLFLIPAFVVPHFLTGVIQESRQMIPLAYVVIPAAFYWIFRDGLADARGE